MTVRIETNYKDLTIIKMNFSEITGRFITPYLAFDLKKDFISVFG